jgi:putative DNA primase/helicase
MTGFPSDLRAVARGLGGEVAGCQVLCPSPGHSPRDRSLSVRLSATSPDGFMVHSFAGDDFRVCRDHVRRLLGIERRDALRRAPKAHRPAPARLPRDDEQQNRKIADALSLWAGGVDPRGTIVEAYLRSRRLDLRDDIAGTVIRWNANIGAMLALFRTVRTDAPQAVSRTFLDCEGRKIERKFLGPVGGAAIKLDADENVLGGLHIGEGIETCLAARQLGLRPVWALGSAGAIAAFPVLSGIEALSLLAEHDDANARASKPCADRWRAGGRAVRIIRPIGGKDINDAAQRQQ